MKKKFVIISSVLLGFGSLSLIAQNATNRNVLHPIVSTKDSLSYAFGANMAMQGLKQHLLQLGVIAEPEAIENSYRSRIENATTNQEKESLKNELKFKQDSIQAATIKNTDLFLKGLAESLPARGSNSAYITGLSVGDQIYKMATEFSKMAFEDKSADNINTQLTIDGIKDVLLNKDIRIGNPESIIQKTMSQAQTRETELKKQQYEGRIEEEKKYMEMNKLQDGVVTLPSGLQYKVQIKGDGAIPTSSDRVKVHYKGTLINGTEFDSSYDRGEPAVFGVTQVISGWTEALQLMPVGSKWLLYIPYDLAYGSRETGPIPAYSNLIFEIELLGIE